MSFQFRCPQGHILQGDLSQVGQLFQCPMCGSSFLIPPPETGPVAAGGFFQGAGAWPAANAPGPGFPAQGGMPGMMPPLPMPMMPGSPYPTPAGQPFAFGPAAANPLPTGPAATPAAPADAPQQTPATSPQSETGKPRFDLGFDPSAKAALPFDLPGHSEFDCGQAPAAPFSAAPLPPPSFPAPSLPMPSVPGGVLPAASFSAPSMPAATFEPMAGGPDFLQSVPATTGQDFLQSVPTTTEETEGAALPQHPPKLLHIRCPSGHLVKATSDLLGKNGRCPACKKTFELRYEDSVEFLRRKEKILQREEIKTGRAWIAWAFLAAFIVFAGLVALMLATSR
jgi:hypothetical protein